MRSSAIAILAMTLLGLFGCENPADILSPAKYERNNIRFSYPQNWKVTEDVEQQDLRYLFVESPGDAVLLVQVYARDGTMPLREYAEWFSSRSKAETSFGNVSKSAFSATEEAAASPVVREQFSITIFGVEVPHIRTYYIRESSQKVAFLIAQAATEDLSMVESGFALILRSFNIE